MTKTISSMNMMLMYMCCCRMRMTFLIPKSDVFSFFKDRLCVA